MSSESAGAGGYEPGALIRHDSAALPEKEWHALIAALEQEHFWERPATVDRGGADGAEWMIEGRRGNRYSIVDRWSPEDTGSSAFMRRLGVDFLRLGKLGIPLSALY